MNIVTLDHVPPSPRTRLATLHLKMEAARRAGVPIIYVDMEIGRNIFKEAKKMSVRWERAVNWAVKRYGFNVLDETYLDPDYDLERYVVVANDGERRYDASTTDEREGVISEVESYLDEGMKVAVYDLDDEKEVGFGVEYTVTLDAVVLK